jgi:hypothetical protein
MIVTGFRFERKLAGLREEGSEGGPVQVSPKGLGPLEVAGSLEVSATVHRLDVAKYKAIVEAPSNPTTPRVPQNNGCEEGGELRRAKS